MNRFSQPAATIAIAERELRALRRSYPDKGECAMRAVIDVELQNLAASRRHLIAAGQAEGTVP